MIKQKLVFACAFVLILFNCSSSDDSSPQEETGEYDFEVTVENGPLAGVYNFPNAAYKTSPGHYVNSGEHTGNTQKMSFDIILFIQNIELNKEYAYFQSGSNLFLSDLVANKQYRGASGYVKFTKMVDQQNGNYTVDFEVIYELTDTVDLNNNFNIKIKIKNMVFENCQIC